MTNQEIKEIFNEVYNVFWIKWRDKPLMPDMDIWDLVILDGAAIMDKHDSQLCRDMVTALVEELNSRSKERAKDGTKTV